MLKNENNKILTINYIAENAVYFHKILQVINSTQRQKYIKYRLPELSRSISRKLSLIRVLLYELNSELKAINKVLKKNKEKVNYYINENKAYSFAKDYRIYKILAYIEAILFEMKSATDLIIRYINRFYTHIFSEKKGEKATIDELKKNKINLEWKYELSHIRRVFTHHYSGWPSFKKQNDSFKLMIDLPKSIKKFKDYKKFPYVKLDAGKINKILEKFFQFNDNAFNFLIGKIYKS